jgi:predicted amidohydrolase
VMGDVAANLDRAEGLIRQAAAGGAVFVVLPEAAVSGYLSQDLTLSWMVPGWPLAANFDGIDVARVAETVPGPSIRRLARLANELDIYLTIPFIERQGSGLEPVYFNTVVLADPHGRLVGHYRKLSPWPWPEQSWATPGDRGLEVVQTPYGPVGLAICFDVHTVFEQYADQDIWTLLYPIAWVDGDHPAEWFWHTLPGQLADRDFNVVGANWSVDDPQEWRGYGFSTIYAPGGRVLSTAHSLHGDEIIYADLETARSAAE